ncbi:MAG: hypothetical protein J6X58_00600 [Bacteroidales bacterium]|nr:hypothetical protein [Bacteroidales bacterium]
MDKTNSSIKLWFDRLLSKNLIVQFAFLTIVLVVLFLLSWFFLQLSGCEWEQFTDNNIPEYLLPLYLLIDSNAFNNLYINGVHGWALFVSSIIYVIGLFIFNGMIISVLTNAIERRVQNHREGHIHYLKSGHYVVMGWDDMVPSIITHIFDKDKDAYVLLMSAAEADNIRERLRKVFNEKQIKKIIINFGHRMSKDYYKDIHIEAAEQVYIVGKRSLPAHDAINVECVDSICAYLNQPEVEGHPKRIVCVFDDLDTYSAFKTSEIFGKVNKLGIEFVPYNFYAGWAKQVFVKGFHKDLDRPGEEIAYPAVYGKGYSENDKTALTENDQRYVHLVFVGTTNFAVAFAMEAAHVLHFPNGNKKATRITFIDLNADKEMGEFITRNRHFFEVQQYRYIDVSGEYKTGSYSSLPWRQPTVFNKEQGYERYVDYDFLDVEFEFIKGDILSASVQNLICEWASDKKGQYLSIFLAMTNQRQNFVMSMNMPDDVYNNEIPIFIRQDRSDNFVSDLREADEAIKNDPKKNVYSVVKSGKLVEERNKPGRYSNIYPFGMNETAYSADDKSLQRAKLINYLYCTMLPTGHFQSILELDTMSKDAIETEANKHWEGLSVALKWSNLYNAYNLRIKLVILRVSRGLRQDDISHDTCSISDNEAEMLARMEHNRWNVEKLLMGFRKPRREEDKYADENVAFKKELNRNKGRFIHHDIRPYDKLDGIKKLDKEFALYIPWIIKMTEKE